jgi:hypothetical protein
MLRRQIDDDDELTVRLAAPGRYWTRPRYRHCSMRCEAWPQGYEKQHERHCSVSS